MLHEQHNEINTKTKTVRGRMGQFAAEVETKRETPCRRARAISPSSRRNVSVGSLKGVRSRSG